MLNERLDQIERNFNTIRKLGRKIDETLTKIEEFNNRHRS